MTTHRNLSTLFMISDIEGILNLTKRDDFLEIKDSTGNTLLHLACSFGYMNLVEKFIKLGFDINTFNYNHETPLYQAVWEGNYKIADYLIKNGANVTLVDDAGNTPLHAAAKSKSNIFLIQLLMNNGADIYAKNSQGNIPLHSSSFENNDILQTFINYNINLNFPDANGETILHDACINNYIEIVQFLIVNNVNLNVINNEGNTPLHLACLEYHTDIANILLFHNAKVTIKNYEQLTALDIVTKQKNTPIINIFEKYNLYNELNQSIISSSYDKTLRKPKL